MTAFLLCSIVWFGLAVFLSIRGLANGAGRESTTTTYARIIVMAVEMAFLLTAITWSEVLMSLNGDNLTTEEARPLVDCKVSSVFQTNALLDRPHL